jgi:glycosyltransferase involved in cell wall biosynthesis
LKVSLRESAADFAQRDSPDKYLTREHLPRENDNHVCASYQPALSGALKVPLSVLVPTRNEEKNIERCLQSVGWAAQIFVVDSCSTDRTSEIARAMGAEIIRFRWDGRGPRKKNWALDNLAWANEWVLVVDADEEVSPSLKQEIAAALAGEPKFDAYSIPYQYYFLGRLMKHGAPLHKLILFKHRLARFEQTSVPEVTGYDVELHEHPVVRGGMGRLRSHMIHHDFDDLHHYFDRHNIYSDWEALLRTRYRGRDRSGEIEGRIFGSATERRRFVKRLFLGLPGKPVIYFLYSYLLHAGFLDGREGFALNILKAFYWYQIGLKEYEIRKAEAAAGQQSIRVQSAPGED